jgi:HD superfamily phosphohydrolase
MSIEDVRIKDRIYKNVNTINFDNFNKLINDDELLKQVYQSKAIKRLDYIYQQGIMAKLNTRSNTVQYNGHKPITRYEHSIGCSILAYYFCMKAKLSEYEIKKQMLIGLLHDISHVAFSHVADVVFKEQYHEKHREEIIKKNEELYDLLLKIEKLPKYNIILERDILHDESDSQLIKAKSPHLNCDRIDYFLRDGYLMGVFSMLEVLKILDHINLIPDGEHKGKLSFDSKEYAKIFFDRTFVIAGDIWNGCCNIVSTNLFAQLLLYAHNKEKIKKDDLINKKDDEIFELLNNEYSDEINIIINQMYSTITRRKTDIDKLTFLEKVPYFIYYNNDKLRVVDPLIVTKDNITPLSKISKKTSGLKEMYDKDIKNNLAYIIIFDKKQNIFETK